MKITQGLKKSLGPKLKDFKDALNAEASGCALGSACYALWEHLLSSTLCVFESTRVRAPPPCQLIISLEALRRMARLPTCMLRVLCMLCRAGAGGGAGAGR